MVVDASAKRPPWTFAMRATRDLRRYKEQSVACLTVSNALRDLRVTVQLLAIQLQRHTAPLRSKNLCVTIRRVRTRSTYNVLNTSLVKTPLVMSASVVRRCRPRVRPSARVSGGTTSYPRVSPSESADPITERDCMGERHISVT